MAKKLYLLLLLFSLVCLGVLHTSSGNNNKKIIPLYGDLSTGTTTVTVPIEASMCAADVEILFTAPLNEITIEVVNEEGEVMTDVQVIAIPGKLVWLNVSALGEGEYTIYFTNTHGEYLYGTFNLE